MHLAFLNPQGNFDPADSYWTAHPDFGGQLVYVKEVALALAEMGHDVDILTRRIIDSDWPEFAAPLDRYPQSDRVRIVRIPCGPDRFLRKEDLWPYLEREWVPNILAFYEQEGRLPDAFTAHYADGGLAAVRLEEKTGVPFTFTAHSLGAQKRDKLMAQGRDPEALEQEFHFSARIAAERLAMSRARRIITSTRQERFEQYAHPFYRGAVDVQDDGRFAVIPPGVNMRIFDVVANNEREAIVRDRIEQALARDLAPERRDLPLVLLSSRLDPKKNHLGVLEAFSRSHRLREKASLAIVVRERDDPLRSLEKLSPNERSILQKIVENAKNAGVFDKITAFSLNNQIELAAGYRYFAARRSVFCLPALYEPFGLAPLEAMACGLPVVVTKNGGPSESLVDEETGERYGVLVDPTDPDDIARGLLEVLNDAARWRDYRDAGLRRVREKYTWPRTADGYLDALESIKPCLRP
ncbi:MAG: glycosyltransferase family 1 protein [Chloroflexi bacterium]|nr:glycosyltransferase family 1 protein [Chloroflexota bacterium]